MGAGMRTKSTETYEIASFNRRLLERIRREAATDARATASRFDLDINVCTTLANTREAVLLERLPNQYKFLARLALPNAYWPSREARFQTTKTKSEEHKGPWFILNQELLLKAKSLAMGSISHCCFALDLTTSQARTMALTSIDSINALALNERPIFTVDLDATMLGMSLNMPPEFADLYAVMYSPPPHARRSRAAIIT